MNCNMQNIYTDILLSLKVCVHTVCHNKLLFLRSNYCGVATCLYTATIYCMLNGITVIHTCAHTHAHTLTPTPLLRGQIIDTNYQFVEIILHQGEDESQVSSGLCKQQGHGQRETHSLLHRKILLIKKIWGSIEDNLSTKQKSIKQ